MSRLGTWHEEHRRTRRETHRWRLWPTSIMGRVALILVLCLLAIQAVIVSFYLYDRTHAQLDVYARSIAGQVVAIVELLEATPPADRPGLLEALNSPLLHVDIAEDRPAVTGMTPWHARRFRRTIVERLHGLGSRPTDVEVVFRPWPGPPGHAHHGGRHRPRLMPSPEKIAISVGQSDGSWLVFTAASGMRWRPWGVRVVFWIGLAAVVILLASMWAAHRVTRPLARFAEAADRLGVDVRAPPLPETGSRELRQATSAFNRMQERLRRLIDDRTLMLAAISHDLRTALTRLKLRTEFIDDAEQQGKALNDLDEMQAMLDATLSFARDDTAAEPRTKTDLAGLVQSLCDDLADAGQPVAYDGPAHAALDCRPVALRRAFANLIDNAVRYGGEATVTLDDRDDEIAVSVADRGPGIPEAMREKVFTPFFRLEGSRSRETGGTGLGLAVARAVVRRHGGDVTLEDRPGGGLLARVTLPRAGT
jgi:signal transduction histidine kinase